MALAAALWTLSLMNPAPQTPLVLENELVRREVMLAPGTGTVSLIRRDSGHEFVRAIEPEAILTIGGKEHRLGGALGQKNRAFILRGELQADPQAAKLAGVARGTCESEVPHGKGWKPKGEAALLTFEGEGFRAVVRHEVYEGLPVFGKQVEVTNTSDKPFVLDRIISERLAAVEGESQVEYQNSWRMPDMTVLTDMSFGGRFDASVEWTTDPAFGTQVSYQLITPCMLNVRPPSGPATVLQPGETFRSIKSFLILHGPQEREAQTLERRAFFRAVAPWTLDNPLMLHVRSSDDKEIRTAIDQASECGFEMVIMSFGSGLNMEDVSDANLSRFRALREYANSKGVRFGGYSLLASRRIDDTNDVINPKTGKTGGAIFGNSPCLGSQWGLDYFEKLKKFISETGFDVLEHDGNYPGDVCASVSHPGHRGLDDSQWKQHEIITEFYRWCRARGVFLNVPDNYFLSGSNKTAMGYRETNWSLPRAQQHVHARQNMFDGTWDKTPSMGWMFVPLVEYHGGGAAATIEPLREHLNDYELHFANTFSNGVQACWRGTRLYDAPETKAMVVRMVQWYKRHRQLLESDTIHLRRPDGRRLDFVVKANALTSPRMMVSVFNPTDKDLKEKVRIPVDRAGLSGRAKIAREGKGASDAFVREGFIELEAACRAQGWTWYTVD